MNKSFEYIQEATWEEVFESWANREENDEGWKAVAKKKGWETWKEWREFMANQFGAQERRWKIFKILDPNLVIPQFRVGPYQGWHKLDYFKDSVIPMKERTFAKLVELKEKQLSVVEKIEQMMRNFPQTTQMIGIRLADGQIVCMEGNHRSTAIALAEKKGQLIDFSQREVTIALTDFTEEESIILLEMLERGSDKVKK